MKRSVQILLFSLYAIGIFAQAPEAFKYQAVVRDASGNIVANQLVSFRLSILQGTSTGSSVFVETQSLTTNNYGLANMEIGNGTLVSGNFALIDWANDLYFIQVEMDPLGGTAYTIMGTSQLLSVPYALNAKTADNVFDGDYNSLTNTPTNVSSFTNDAGYITNPNDADSDPNNEIQHLSLTTNFLDLDNGGNSVNLTPYLDNTDAQTLNLSGSTLSISNGNNVNLSNTVTADSNWTVSGANIYNNNLGKVGIGTIPSGPYRLTVKTSGSEGIQVTNGSNGSINLNVNPGANPYLFFSDGVVSTMLSQLAGGNFVIDTYGGAPYQFEMEPNGTGTGIYINSSSQVGIGTTNPTSELEVNGQVKITGGTPGAGKLLVSDAVGLASWQSVTSGPSEEFKATLSAGGNYNQAGQVVIYNSVSFDPNGNYNPASGVYTAPSTGLYLFMVTRTASYGGGGSQVNLWLRVNGVVNTAMVGDSGAFGNVASGQTMLMLNAGDQIDMFHIGGNTTTSFTGGGNHFQGYKLK